MKRAPLLAAALATTLLGSSAALAQHDRHYRDYRGGHGGYAWVRPGPRFYYPYSVYGSPYYGTPYYASPYYLPPYYPFGVYAPRPPVYVERYYIEDAPPPAEPPQRSYSERSYAQAEPRRPAAPPAAPRMERITLSAKELFAFDEAKLRPPQPRLDEIAELMNRNPQIGKVRITGFTDRIGTQSYNARLSQRRAQAVKAYLVAKGVAASRLTVLGKGEADPVVECSDKRRADLIKCLEPNRRVEVEEITVERRVPQ